MCTAKLFAEGFAKDALFADAGESSTLMEPNWMPVPPIGFPPTGPPLGKYPDAPAALIVTEGFRP